MAQPRAFLGPPRGEAVINRRGPQGGGRPHRRVLVGVLLLNLSPLARNMGAESGQPVDEYQAKAAFLYSVAKFVDWPQFANGGTQPVRICVLGRSRLQHELEETVRDKKINDRSLTVSGISRTKDACNCELVFVSSAEQKRLKPTLLELKQMNVLTVGESQGFSEAGGMVTLEFTNDRIRLAVNQDSAAAANLMISSKLLRLARIVKTSL